VDVKVLVPDIDRVVVAVEDSVLVADAERVVVWLEVPVDV
jgi:hypothetical protein